jgi:ferrous iron transport protein B
MEILFGQDVTGMLTAASAAALLVFSLLYTPCVAAIAAIRRELGRKWSLGVVLWQCVIAWIAAAITHLIAVVL